MRCWCLAVVSIGAFISTQARAQVINEFVANHTGTDEYSYVEVAGPASTDLSNHTVVEVLGDTTDGDDEPGAIGNIWMVSSTDSTGVWVSAYGVANGAGDIDNGTKTLFLVTGFSGSLGQDLDTNNDGVLDTTPWTSVVDVVAVADGGADLVYSSVVLGPNFDGISSFEPGGASRIPNGVDTDAIGDWKRNDFDGAGLPGFGGGTGTGGEVPNSPGLVNTDGPAAPLGLQPVIDEFIVDHQGTDTEESIEIWGQISQPYPQVALLVVDSDSSGVLGRVDQVFQVGTTNGVGIWSTGSLGTEALDNQSSTLLLVLGWSGSVGDDLDTDDNGIMDLMPWTQLLDDLGIDDGSGSDLFYSAVVLAPGFDGNGDPVGGASRVPSGVDTNAISDWVRNDFDGAGLVLGTEATLGPDEAWNTPAAINRVREADYWNGVEAADATSLRAAIHQRLDDHQRLAYSSGDADTWDVLELADEDPLDSAKVVAIYKNETYTKFGGGMGPYNREHSWPQSYGFPDNTLDNSPRSDAHHLFLSNPTYNGNRGNRPFGSCSSACAEHATLSHNGVGGVGGPYPGDSSWSDGTTYEVWNHRRGDIARAQLYLDVRYEGGAHGATEFAEPDLVLTDNVSLITTSGTNATGTAYMGRLATLLEWHLEDPVDEGDRRRNDIIWTFQGNRNPFIDHPEWVGCVFQDLCESGIFSDGFEGGSTDAWSP